MWELLSLLIRYIYLLDLLGARTFLLCENSWFGMKCYNTSDVVKVLHII